MNLSRQYIQVGEAFVTTGSCLKMGGGLLDGSLLVRSLSSKGKKERRDLVVVLQLINLLHKPN